MAPGFLNRLFGSSGREPLPPEDGRLAIAAVLVMAARTDDAYGADERAVVDETLMGRFGLSAAEAQALRAEAEEAESESVDIYKFTKAIKTAIPLEDRVAIVEALWRVVLADGQRDPLEDTLMRQIVDLLGLSPMESALARQKVQGGGSIQA